MYRCMIEKNKKTCKRLVRRGEHLVYKTTTKNIHLVYINFHKSATGGIVLNFINAI